MNKLNRTLDLTAHIFLLVCPLTLSISQSKANSYLLSMFHNENVKDTTDSKLESYQASIHKNSEIQNTSPKDFATHFPTSGTRWKGAKLLRKASSAICP